MAFSNLIESVTLEANADLSSHQFKIVELMSTGLARLATTDNGYGILQNIPEANEAGTIAIKGQSKIIAGGTLTTGQHIKVLSGGWGVAVLSGAAHSNAFVTIGQAVTDAVSGGIGTVEIDRKLITGVASGAAWPF